MQIKMFLKKIIIAIISIGMLSACIPVDLYAFPEEDEHHIEQINLNDDNYVENEVFAVCDSEDEALNIAEEYSIYSGYDFTLDEYAHGVAIYTIGDENASDKDDNNDFKDICDNSDTVTAAVSAGLAPELDLVEVFPDYYLELTSVEKPDNLREGFNDPFTKSDSDKYQWYHEMIGDKLVWDEMNLLAKANLDPYDDIVYDGPLPDDFIDNLNNEVVAVIDSGINEYHEDFILPGGGSVIVAPSDVTGCATGYTDLIGHGSNVAGIIGNVADNLKGGRGIAGGVKIMPINVCPNASGTGIKTSSSIQAVNLAIEKKEAYLNDDPDGLNICVINMSLGGSSYTASFNKAVQDAMNLGITVVAAATNNNSSAYGYPASYDNVISVASVNSYYVKSGFSNYGDKISICAPGGERTRTIEEIGVMDDGEECYASVKGSDASYDGYHGTSQASPMVAACAALLYAENPDITPYEVKKRMEETAKDVYDSYELGAGCLNVAAALGVDRDIAAPVADKESGMVIPSGFSVNLSVPGIDLSEYEGSIYYTTDGTDPDIRNGESTYELDLQNPAPIYFEYDEFIGNETETLKVMSVLFGKKSEIVSYQYKYYLGYDIPKAVRDDGANLIDNTLEVAIDKTIGLRLCDVKSGEEIAANWISSDPLAVSVDSKGKVSGLSIKDTPTLITAVPIKDSYMPVEIPVYVKCAATNLELDLIHDDNCIEMYCGDTLDLGGEWRILPYEASQNAIFSSSKPSSVSVDNEGLVTAASVGSSVIKVTAADGSGVYDTLNIKVLPALSGLCIENISGNDFISAGGTMKFKLFTDDYKTVPNSADIYWDFSEESKMHGIEYYATVNHKTGTVSAKSNDYIYFAVDAEVVAESLYFGVSDSYEFKIYPRLESLSLNKDYSSSEYGCYSKKDSVFYFKSYKSIDINEYFDDVINVVPSECAKSFVYKSSNEKVAYIVPSDEGIDGNSPGIIKTRAPGSATLTISSTDGSGRSIRIPIVVLDTVSVKNNSAVDCISPGKSVSFSLITDSGKTVPKGNVEWSVSGVKMTSGFEMTNLVSVNEKTGVVTMKASTYSEVRDFLKRSEGKGYDYLIVSAKYYPSSDSDFCYTASKYIKVIPTLTSLIKIRNNTGDVISELNFSHIGEKAAIYPYSLPDSALNSGYTYSSSKPSVVRVNTDGEIEAVSKGTAYVYVKAGDLSGKSAKLKVCVNYPYVSRLVLSENEVYLRTPLSEGMTDPEGSKYKETADFRVTEITPAEAYGSVSVASLNESIAKVKIKEGSDINDPVYTIVPVNKGTTRIRVTALDGSKKTAYIRVNVVRPNVNFTLNLGTLKASESKNIKLITEGSPSNKKVKYDFCGQGSSAEEREASVSEMKKYVSLNSSTGALKVKNANAIGTEERLIYVYAEALDDWHYTSEPLLIRIRPGIVYINELRVRSSNNRYETASGTKINMKALCNEDATDRSISWLIYDEDENHPGFPKSEEGSLYASINRNGVVNVSRGLQNRRTVFVKAKATHGTMTESAAVKLSLYPKIKSITVSGASSVDKGECIVLSAEALSEGYGDSLNKFKVTYSTGYAKVYLETNPLTGEYDGTCVSVHGIKKGRTRITFTALDGSSKKTVFYVNTL